MITCVYLIIRHDKKLLVLLSYIMCISLVSYFDSTMSIQIFFYGARDILFICSLLILPKLKLVMTRSDIIFIMLVLLLALINIFDNIFQLGISEAVFRKEEYFSKKGTYSNFGFGLVGERIYYPFYTPNLLSTFISLVAFALLLTNLSRFRYSFVLTIVNLFTVSKVFFFYVFLSFIKRIRLNVKFFIFVLFLMLALSEKIIYHIYLSIDDPLLKYHLASVIGHLKAFDALSWQNMSLIPEPLGSNSIIAQYIYDQEKVFGIESTIFVRLSELHLHFVILLLFIVFKTLKFHNSWRVFIYSILLLLALTATSNHPVVYGSAALIISSYRKGNARYG